MFDDNKPLPDYLKPKEVGIPPRPGREAALAAVETELAGMIASDHPATETPTMQERTSSNGNPPAAPYQAPPPPRPMGTATIPNMPGPQQPASAMEIQFNGKTLRVNSTCNTDIEATQLIGALTALVPFLAKKEGVA
jgi:hypothetical protein